MASASSTVAARLDRLPRAKYTRQPDHPDLARQVLRTLRFVLRCLHRRPGLFAGKLFTPTTQMFFGFEGFASFVAAQFAGMFIGTILVNDLSDRYGRRAMFTYSLLWYSAASLDPHGVPERRVRRQTCGASSPRSASASSWSRSMPSCRSWCRKEHRGRAFAFNQTPAVLHRAAGRPSSPTCWCRHSAVGLGRLALGGGDRLGRRAMFIWIIRLGTA